MNTNCRCALIPAEETAMAKHQNYKDDGLDRKDHVWIRCAGGSWKWKCILCGAVTNDTLPPAYPTDTRWTPERYERLVDEERQLVRGSKH